jgi:hypothetical protein
LPTDRPIAVSGDILLSRDTRGDDPPPVGLHGDDPPTVPVGLRGDDPPTVGLRGGDPPTVGLRGDDPPTVGLRGDDPPTVPVGLRGDDPPPVSPGQRGDDPLNLHEVTFSGSEDGEPRCNYCGLAESDSTPLKYCKGCLGWVYCSKRCQRAHWKSGHREECLEFQRLNRLYRGDSDK